MNLTQSHEDTKKGEDQFYDTPKPKAFNKDPQISQITQIL
jgi:hypothetical protein